MSIFKRVNDSTTTLPTWLDDLERYATKARRRRLTRLIGRAAFLIGLALVTTFKSENTAITPDPLVATQTLARQEEEEATSGKPSGEENDALQPREPQLGPRPRCSSERIASSEAIPDKEKKSQPEPDPTEDAIDTKEAVTRIREWLREKGKKR